ncbi:hypothetical protein ACFVYP_28705 [Kitasatospora sp. NPDC058201]|uniref:hypothetical protein n=1 Tax=Streptomycetaceae TaxID=2062 RepID=UPI002E7A4440|nr:hypothetical protein [Streptomyces sp. BE303]MED7952678.1 hypothetical protein [Streptomyces sp. BE303]
MGIFDRFRHKEHAAAGEDRSSLGGGHEQDTTAMADSAQRAALAHDEAADAFNAETQRAREVREAEVRESEARRSTGISEREAEERARENMTAEGDPWD